MAVKERTSHQLRTSQDGPSGLFEDAWFVDADPRMKLHICLSRAHRAVADLLVAPSGERAEIAQEATAKLMELTKTYGDTYAHQENPGWR